MQRKRVVGVGTVVAVLVLGVVVIGLVVWRGEGTVTQRSAGPTARASRPSPSSTAPRRSVPRTDVAPRRAAAWPSPRRTRGPRPAPAAARYAFPVAGCPTQYVAAHHDYPAADMFAARGCTFVSPVAGVVDEVNRTDRWDPATNVGADRGGLSVSVVGVDGVRYYGSHLEAVLPRVRPGMHVALGTALGRIGDTGSARGVGTHLHFGISWPTPPGRWWIRRGAVPPAAYLDAWRAGRNLSPVSAVAAAKRAYGDDSRCHSYC